MPALARDAVGRPHPISIIKAAVTWALAQRLPVAVGPIGVHVTSCSARLTTWERDRDATLSPLGCVLLHLHPQPRDVDRAIEVALGVPGVYVEALVAGMERTPLSPSSRGRLTAEWSRAGSEHGSMLRAWLHAKLRAPRRDVAGAGTES